MEKVIDAVIEMLHAQGHTVRTQVSKRTAWFEIDGFPVTREEMLELVNGVYSVEELRERFQMKSKASG